MHPDTKPRKRILHQVGLVTRRVIKSIKSGLKRNFHKEYSTAPSFLLATSPRIGTKRTSTRCSTETHSDAEIETRPGCSQPSCVALRRCLPTPGELLPHVDSTLFSLRPACGPIAHGEVRPAAQPPPLSRTDLLCF